MPELKVSPLLVRTVTYTLQNGDVHAPADAHAPLDVGSLNKDARTLPAERRPPLPVSVHGKVEKAEVQAVRPPRSAGSVAKLSNKAVEKAARVATAVVAFTNDDEPEMHDDTVVPLQSWTVALTVPSLPKGLPKLRPSMTSRSGVALLPQRKLSWPDWTGGGKTGEG